jgi:hypothetical protein
MNPDGLLPCEHCGGTPTLEKDEDAYPLAGKWVVTCECWDGPTSDCAGGPSASGHTPKEAVCEWNERHGVWP